MFRMKVEIFVDFFKPMVIVIFKSFNIQTSAKQHYIANYDNS